MGAGKGGDRRGAEIVTGAMAAAIRIESLTSLEHLQRCVDLQVAVWRYSDDDVVPRRVFVVAQRIGGQVLGAFDGEEIVGFAMALPGYRDGTAYLHSYMLAVLPQYRNAGLGRGLKLAQRDDAIARGFDLMEWTFDPLEIKNAHLNLHRLGAIARRYQPDFYGASSSPLQGGLPTDRLYAEWWLRSERVCKRLETGGVEAGGSDLIEDRVEVSAEIYDWKADPGRGSEALALQTRVRKGLQQAFGRGLVALGYERDANGNGTYLLGTAWGLPTKT